MSEPWLPAAGSSGHCTLVLVKRLFRPRTVWHCGDRCRNQSRICYFSFAFTSSTIIYRKEWRKQWRTRESRRDALFPQDYRSHMYSMTAVNERCDTVRTPRALSTEWVGAQSTSSCSVGGGISVGGNPESGKWNGRKRKKEREKSTHIAVLELAL